MKQIVKIMLKWNRLMKINVTIQKKFENHENISETFESKYKNETSSNKTVFLMISKIRIKM